MGQLSTGNKIVDEVSKINFSGNITPRTWRKTITKENGKPYPLARDLLAEFVYWYRAKEEVDEDTHEITMEKKFRDDLLFMSYKKLSQEFGESKRVLRDALNRLEDIGVIKRYYRTITYTDGTTVNNVMYIELIPDVLVTLTYGTGVEDKKDCLVLKKEKEPAEQENRTSLPPSNKNDTREITETEHMTPPSDKNVNRVVTKLYPYTENTSKNTKNYNNSNLSIQSQNDWKAQGEVCPVDGIDGTETFVNTFLQKTAVWEEEKKKNGESSAAEICFFQQKRKLKQELLKKLPENSKETYPLSFVNSWYDYEDLIKMTSSDRKRINLVMNILYDTLNSTKRTIRISGEDKPASVVKGRLLKLNCGDILYALEKYDEQTTKIRNHRAYLLTVLYLAKEQQELDIQNQVQHDMYGKKEE